MKKYLLYILAVAAMCIYIWLGLQNLRFSPGKLLNESDYDSFIVFSEKLALTTGAALLISLTLTPLNSNKPESASSHVWLHGVFAILIPSAILTLVFNPIGIFPWQSDNVRLNARVHKPLIYKRLDPVPDIIFLGTSNSFHIAAQNYAEKITLNAFNFSLEAANPVDYFTLTNEFLSQSDGNKKPAVIVTEIYSPNLSPRYIESWKEYPLEHIKYMPSNYALETINSQFIRTLSLDSLSTVIFVEYFSWKKQWIPINTFGDDGLILPYPIYRTYQERVAQSAIDLDDILRCKKLDSDGKDLILKMVALSREQKASLIFYRSPLNRDFYTSEEMLFRYAPCSKKIDEFMLGIQQENDNVFYLNLTNYPPISSGGSTTFIDAHHLTDAGSEELLKALTPTILDALLLTGSIHQK